MEMLHKKIKKIVEDTETLSGKIFDFIIQIFIVLSLLSFSLETLPNIQGSFKIVLHTFEIFSIVVFTVEYILRIISSNNKILYIFSFYGLLDLAAILPFWVGLKIDLRFIRIFRLFRIIRIFKLFRFNKALKRLLYAFKSIYQELLLFFISILFLIFISSAGIYFFENPVQPDKFSSIFHSAWWSIITLTTVGYGDIYPVTVGGKIFTFFILVIGIGVVAVPTGLVSSALMSYPKDII